MKYIYVHIYIYIYIYGYVFINSFDLHLISNETAEMIRKYKTFLRKLVS